MARGSKQQIFLPVDVLVRLYVDEKWNSYQLAAHFDCSPPTVLKELSKAGVVRKKGNAVRGKPQRRHIPIDELCMLYVDQRLSADEIGERFGCSNQTVLAKLRLAGIKVRHHNDTKRGAPSPLRIVLSADLTERIIKMYLENSTLGASELARSIGHNLATVRRVLKENSVPLKSLSQVIVGKRNGPANPNWRDDLTPDERANRRDNAKQVAWRTKVYERDKFTCIKCGDARGRNLNAHHIESHNSRRDLR